MTCSSRSWMVLACLHWSESTWEAPWVSTSLMAMEQRASSSQTVWAQVALASLTVVEQRASASRVAWVQMALASLTDSAVSESFWWSSMPSSQTTFHLQALMDDLEASSSSRSLLAFSQRWLVSVRGVLLLGPGDSAMGEIVVGTSSREASAISSSGVLTWDDVSTGPERSLSLWAGGVSMTRGLVLLGSSSLTCDQMCLTSPKTGRLLNSMVNLTSFQFWESSLERASH